MDASRINETLAARQAKRIERIETSRKQGTLSGAVLFDACGVEQVREAKKWLEKNPRERHARGDSCHESACAI
jgi:hypothetical protein